MRGIPSQIPSQSSKTGDTAKQFHKFLSILLSEKDETIKKSFQRVEKIIDFKDLTKDNKADRLRQLNNVLLHFRSINLLPISKKIERLIEKIDNTSFK
jgi:hypothetical protein